MGRRAVRLHYVCAHDGCDKRATFSYESGKAAYGSYEYRAYGDGPKGKWKCCKHDNPDDVLSPANRRIVWESEPVRQESYGKFCGPSGVIIGSGHHFEPGDFPVGTVLRVTAEVILPEATDATT